MQIYNSLLGNWSLIACNRRISQRNLITRTPHCTKLIQMTWFHRARITLLNQLISTECTLPRWNSSTMTARVDTDTLYVEFCCGQAGVMMGITWYRSDGFTYEVTTALVSTSLGQKKVLRLLNSMATYPRVPDW